MRAFCPNFHKAQRETFGSSHRIRLQNEGCRVTRGRDQVRFSPMLLLHICAGTLGCLSGALAVSFRKGSQRHRMAGNIFVLSMLSLGASGAYLAFLKSQPGNVLGGTLTFYLVATAWMTARRRDGETDLFDWGALLAALAIGAVTVTFGLEAATSQTGLKHGYAAGPYFFLGSVALICATGDLRLLVRGGISGTRRIARHLWRMCYAWFIASASIFLARAHIFPTLLRKTGVLFLLSFLPLILMIFWLIRVRFKNAYDRNPVPGTGDAYSLRTHPLSITAPRLKPAAKENET